MRRSNGRPNELIIRASIKPGLFLRRCETLAAIKDILLSALNNVECGRLTWPGLCCDGLGRKGGAASPSLIDSRHTEAAGLTRLET